MTSRRDFLTRLSGLAVAIVVAPASALATVQRLGTPADWVDATPSAGGHCYVTRQSGLWYDPATWVGGSVPAGPLSDAEVTIGSDHTVTLRSTDPSVCIDERAVLRMADRGRLEIEHRRDPYPNPRIRSECHALKVVSLPNRYASVEGFEMTSTATALILRRVPEHPTAALAVAPRLQLGATVPAPRTSDPRSPAWPRGDRILPGTYRRITPSTPFAVESFA